MTYRILTCDDESFITRSISIKLARAGYDVATAVDGEDALKSIREKMPAVLISDCQMPRMDGLELCRRLREEPATAELPIILLTAKGYELDHDEVRHTLRVSHIVPKPFSPRELLNLVNEIVVGIEQSQTTTSADGDPTTDQAGE